MFPALNTSENSSRMINCYRLKNFHILFKFSLRISQLLRNLAIFSLENIQLTFSLPSVHVHISVYARTLFVKTFQFIW